MPLRALENQLQISRLALKVYGSTERKTSKSDVNESLIATFETS